MARRSGPLFRQLRTSSPLKLVLLLVVVALFIFPWRSGNRLSLSETALSELWTMPREEVAKNFEIARRAELLRRGYDAVRTAQRTRTPVTLPDGTPSLSADVDVYVDRLSKFVAKAFAKSASRAKLEDAVSRVKRHAPPQSADLPKLLFSTDRLGEAGVADLFRLWDALLPIPLAPPLADLLPETEWAEPARLGGTWKSVVADDGQIDAQAAQWSGESVSGKTEWAKTWHKLNFGVLRADFYRWVCLTGVADVQVHGHAVRGRHLCRFRYCGEWRCALPCIRRWQTGKEADPQPVAHPYVWGIDAKSIVHPNLDLIEQILQNHERGITTTRERVWERRQVNGTVEGARTPDLSDEGQIVLTAESERLGREHPSAETPKTASTSTPRPPLLPANVSHAGPVYPSSQRHSKRAPFLAETIPPDDATSLLSPEINIVVAIEWDSSIAWDWRRWMQWSGGRFRRSLKKSGDGRDLQFAQYVLAVSGSKVDSNLRQNHFTPSLSTQWRQSWSFLTRKSRTRTP